MIYSMTAYTSHDINLLNFTAHWELRSINHRYLEIHFKLPHSLGKLEYSLREMIRKEFHRGKIDCLLKLTSMQNAEKNFKVDFALIEGLMKIEKDINARFSLNTALTMSDILQWPSAIQVTEADFSTLQTALEDSFSMVLQDLKETRAREGLKLKNCIEMRLEKMQVYTSKIKDMLPKIQNLYLERAKEKIKELTLETNQIPIESILANLIQKIDVSEEIDRMNAHLTEVERVLSNENMVGRRLDFLMQELNREINTLSAKSIDTLITQHCIELKLWVEEIREQVQNLE